MEYRKKYYLFEKNVGKKNDQHPMFYSTNHRGREKKQI